MYIVPLFYARTLDEIEADLRGMQHSLFRIRKALQAHIGETVGFQYDDDDCRAVAAKGASEQSGRDRRGR